MLKSFVSWNGRLTSLEPLVERSFGILVYIEFSIKAGDYVKIED